MPSEMNRREFLAGAAATAATFTIVPRRVLGGPGFVAPSDKITLACIGFGTQAIRRLAAFWPARTSRWWRYAMSTGKAWATWSGAGTQIRDGIRRLIENPAWREGVNQVPAD